jgi:crotonobetainyl-CoA:carnitine CoA-transferase CaiB-like acyl-CoA transferase
MLSIPAAFPDRPLPTMFSDLTVLELASVLAGPSVGQFFAEWGATVIKVENPRTEGDVTRRWTTPKDGGETESVGDEDDRSAYFCACNHGKQSLALDLSTGDGRALLHDLVEDVDVVLASFRPGTAEALGADYETLSDLNPALLYGHVTGYGPADERPGYDAAIQAESGFMSINGPADGPPMKLPVALMDVLAAHQLKEGLLMALLRRERTGDGAYVPVSLLQAAVSGLVNQATNYLVGDHVPRRMGSRHPNIAPYGTAYETFDDRAVVLAVGTDRQFEALCHIIGTEALPQNPNFATNEARVEHRDALERVLTVRIRQMETGPLLDALEEARVPAAEARSIDAVFDQPAADAMVLRPEEDLAGLRQSAFTLQSFRSSSLENPTADAPADGPDRVSPGSASPGSAVALAPAPHYAEHTAGLLQQRGFSPAHIQTLADDGVIDLPETSPSD